jgi:outer membrane protein OmpA-like peptidoglycan-associated protein
MQLLAPPIVICTCLLAMQAAATNLFETETAGPRPATRLTIERNDTGLQITGNASSQAHATILRESVRQILGNDAEDQLDLDLIYGTLTPPGWSLITEMVLRAVLATRHASAEVTADAVNLQGVAADPETWEKAIRRVDAALLDEMRLEYDVLTVDGSETYQTLCRRQFLQLARNNRIEFFNSGAKINSDAYRSLDAMVELAIQCPGLSIEVIGHTDASGEEAVNQVISKARAESVVTYMIDRGLPDRRLTSAGAGSANPLVPESNRNARQRNRRVEFRLIEP